MDVLNSLWWTIANESFKKTDDWILKTERLPKYYRWRPMITIPLCVKSEGTRRWKIIYSYCVKSVDSPLRWTNLNFLCFDFHRSPVKIWLVITHHSSRAINQSLLWLDIDFSNYFSFYSPKLWVCHWSDWQWADLESMAPSSPFQVQILYHRYVGHKIVCSHFQAICTCQVSCFRGL